MLFILVSIIVVLPGSKIILYAHVIQFFNIGIPVFIHIQFSGDKLNCCLIYITSNGKGSFRNCLRIRSLKYQVWNKRIQVWRILFICRRSLLEIILGIVIWIRYFYQISLLCISGPDTCIRYINGMCIFFIKSITKPVILFCIIFIRFISRSSAT